MQADAFQFKCLSDRMLLHDMLLKTNIKKKQAVCKPGSVSRYLCLAAKAWIDSHSSRQSVAGTAQCDLPLEKSGNAPYNRSVEQPS